MKTIERVRRTAVSTNEWEPLRNVGRTQISEAHWLRRRAEGGWSHTAIAVALRPDELRLRISWGRTFCRGRNPRMDRRKAREGVLEPRLFARPTSTAMLAGRRERRRFQSSWRSCPNAIQ